MVNKYPMLIKSSENTELFIKNDKCDKYDYLIAAGCGALGGIVDIFLVGMPGESVIGKWTDSMTDNVVMMFAKQTGWSPKAKNVNNVNSAIGHLERTFKVNYDQRLTTDVEDIFNITPGSHHMMSLAHSPDVMGLFFSILNQFTNTSSFITNRQLITISTKNYELLGGNLVTKILCGVVNWFGHLMSDISGSSGSHGRGVGIAAPFFELFGLCKFGSFSTDIGRKDLAEIATRAFTMGYDFRFVAAQAVPLIITEMSIRLIWALRRHFQYDLPLRDCIPTDKHPDLRIMLLVGSGTLCVLDGADALIRSGGNTLLFFMRLNLVAWFRFAFLVIKEVLTRLGFNVSVQSSINAMMRINAALIDYLNELEKIDIELFKKEEERYNQMANSLSAASSEEDLNRILITQYEQMGIKLPWDGYDSFDDFMKDKNARLVFD